MKTRAAVAYRAGQPLVVEEVELEGPKAGEVLVEIKAKDQSLHGDPRA
jgi:S-(hydroxymethyl)glutathione dehydrogenase/alcohol dehydrogenase